MWLIGLRLIKKYATYCDNNDYKHTPCYRGSHSPILSKHVAFNGENTCDYLLIRLFLRTTHVCAGDVPLECAAGSAGTVGSSQRL